MRTAAMFFALMATGVGIVLAYIWSGESIVVLILSIISLFAVVGIAQWQPWAIDGQSQIRSGGQGPAATLLNLGSTTDSPSAAASDGPLCWRCEYNVTWDERGISGVVLGSKAPQMWSWSQIDDIGQEWAEGVSDDSDLDNERLALRLDFPNLRNREEPDKAWIMYGQDQHPDQVQVEARDAWRESKVTRSRFHDLSAEERTLKLADYFAPDGIDVSKSIRSPSLLYQEIRRSLLGRGTLCRLSDAASFDEVVDAFDGLLAANDAQPITRDEEDELKAADGPDRVASLHWTLDWIAEQRGYRVAFLDQSRTPAGTRNLGRRNQRPDPDEGPAADSGADEYLIGLIPASSADDWDGQTVGSGSAKVVLDRPL